MASDDARRRFNDSLVDVAKHLKREVINLDPTARFAKAPGSTPDFTLVSVYRRKNAATLSRLVEDAPSASLWGLDGVADELVHSTAGEGPGWRFPLLNRLFNADDDRYLVVADDDVQLRPGDLRRLVRIAAAFNLDLCQPAHGPRSQYSHNVTLRRPFSLLRLTTFVEIGPLFVVSPSFRKAITPFPETQGMGWGVDVEWGVLREQTGARFGIVDAVKMRHTGAVGVAYEAGVEGARLDQVLATHNIDDMYEPQRTLATVRPWATNKPGELS